MPAGCCGWRLLLAASARCPGAVPPPLPASQPCRPAHPGPVLPPALPQPPPSQTIDCPLPRCQNPLPSVSIYLPSPVPTTAEDLGQGRRNPNRHLVKEQRKELENYCHDTLERWVVQP